MEPCAPDGDFAAYVAARWPVLVRMLVLLGGRREEAEDAVARAWPATTSTGRGSATVTTPTYTCAAACWRPGGGGAEAGGAPAADDSAPELVALEHQLDRLTGDERLALVLRFATGLDEQQVAAVLDMPPAAVPGLVARALSGPTSRPSGRRADERVDGRGDLP